MTQPTLTKKEKQMIHYALGQSLCQSAQWQRERKVPSVILEQEMKDISKLMSVVDKWPTTD